MIGLVGENVSGICLRAIAVTIDGGLDNSRPFGNHKWSGVKPRALRRFRAIDRVTDFPVPRGVECKLDAFVQGLQLMNHSKNVLGIVAAHFLVHRCHSGNVLHEPVERFPARLTPLDFAQCGQTRKQHVFQMRVRGYEFRPKIRLDSKNMRLLFIRHPKCKRLIFIDLPDRDIAADAVRLRLPVLALAIVQVHIQIRSHYDIVTKSRSLYSAIASPPRHHDSVKRSVTLKNLVPTDKPPSVCLKKLADTLRDIALEQLLGGVVIVGLQPEFLYPGLTL